MIFQCDELVEADWQRLSLIRIRALVESGQWFSGDLAKEQARGEADWRRVLSQAFWLVFTESSRDVALMSVERAEPIRGTDCWMASCWVEPDLRGRGITRRMIEELDRICRREGWRTQGLGVWPNNDVAIRAYQRVGFEKVGEPVPSRSKPGQLYQMMQRTLPA